MVCPLDVRIVLRSRRPIRSKVGRVGGRYGRMSRNGDGRLTSGFVVVRRETKRGWASVGLYETMGETSRGVIIFELASAGIKGETSWDQSQRDSFQSLMDVPVVLRGSGHALVRQEGAA